MWNDDGRRRVTTQDVLGWWQIDLPALGRTRQHPQLPALFDRNAPTHESVSKNKWYGDRSKLPKAPVFTRCSRFAPAMLVDSSPYGKQRTLTFSRACSPPKPRWFGQLSKNGILYASLKRKRFHVFSRSLVLLLAEQIPHFPHPSLGLPPSFFLLPNRSSNFSANLLSFVVGQIQRVCIAYCPVHTPSLQVALEFAVPDGDPRASPFDLFQLVDALLLGVSIDRGFASHSCPLQKITAQGHPVEFGFVPLADSRRSAATSGECRIDREPA